MPSLNPAVLQPLTSWKSPHFDDILGRQDSAIASAHNGLIRLQAAIPPTP